MLCNPCLTCGACCALYRASFYWAEASDAGGPVPVELTEPVSPWLRAMRGTNQSAPRCVALSGTIGEAVHCTIYDHRPTGCREFPVAWTDGQPNPRCDTARLQWGLPPLRPDDSSTPTVPRAA